MTAVDDWNSRAAEWAKEWQGTDRSFGVVTGHLLEVRGPGKNTCIKISEDLVRIARKRGAVRVNLSFSRMNADQ